jgi:leucyl/phenylalanyl-tRNA--protein transferase
MARADPDQPSAELLIEAYRRGIFPMVSDAARLEWYSPDPRGVLPLDGFHVPRSLARLVRSGRFELRTDTCFETVMRACAAPRPDADGTWIDERLIAAYCDLHRRGAAHSIEAYFEDQLVGGLYGVHLGRAFFGESMFSRPDQGGSNASKVCLVRLVALLRERGFLLLDTQFQNEHLRQFGCVEIPRDEYLRLLTEALHRRAPWPSAGKLAG